MLSLLSTIKMHAKKMQIFVTAMVTADMHGWLL